MKITTEIEINWINEDGSLNPQTEDRLINAIANSIQAQFCEEAAASIAAQAKKVILAKTEYLIDSVLEQPVVISDGWQQKESYDSIFAMVEKKMTNLYTGKISPKGGTCEKDPLLARIETTLKNETDRRLKVIEQYINNRAASIAKEAVNSSKLAKVLEVAVEQGQRSGLIVTEKPGS